MGDQDSIQEGRGRSAQKRAAKAVEELAIQLVELPESELGRLPLDSDLRRELTVARATRGHSSKRRQIKHFAGALRRNDAQRAAIEAHLNGYQLAQAGDRQDFHRLEALRDRLCDERLCEAALAEVGTLWPATDLQKLAGLARSVQNHGDKKAARDIFRRLRQASDNA